MDITRISGTDQGLAALSASQTSRTQTPVATATPVLPDNDVRVPATQAAQLVSVSKAEVARSLEAINRFVQPVSADITFSQDEETGQTVVKVIDTRTQTILRQIPTKEAMEIAKQLDKLQGLLIREKV